jgi:hypothetical protein
MMELAPSHRAHHSGVTESENGVALEDTARCYHTQKQFGGFEHSVFIESIGINLIEVAYNALLKFGD